MTIGSFENAMNSSFYNNGEEDIISSQEVSDDLNLNDFNNDSNIENEPIHTLSNFDDLPDLNLSGTNEELPEKNFEDLNFESNNEIEEVETKPTRKRGRPSLNTMKKEAENIISSNNSENQNSNIQNYSSEEINYSEKLSSQAMSNIPYNNLDVSPIEKKIIDVVCNNTLNTLINAPFESEVFAPSYKNKLLNGFRDGSISVNDPFFKKLIEEFIQKGYTDPYLGNLTTEILKYIIERK